ncbi:MAG TPA: hypothetical protein VLC46_05970, partial [Thermoanaerobaculia bacterium]|nr:hypothetical protein [Thermoanaerobaculia bacterium]
RLPTPDSRLPTPTADNRQRAAGADNAQRATLMLFSLAMNAPLHEVNESTVCPVDSSLWL